MFATIFLIGFAIWLILEFVKDIASGPSLSEIRKDIEKQKKKKAEREVYLAGLPPEKRKAIEDEEYWDELEKWGRIYDDEKTPEEREMSRRSFRRMYNRAHGYVEEEDDP